MKTLQHYIYFGFYVLLWGVGVTVGVAMDIEEKTILWLILGVVIVTASVIAKGFILMDEHLRKLQCIQEDIRDQTHRQ
jgi:hypothetical protein